MDEENSYEEEDIIRDKEVNPKNKGTIRKDDIRYNINDIILERKDLNYLILILIVNRNF